MSVGYPTEQEAFIRNQTHPLVSSSISAITSAIR